MKSAYWFFRALTYCAGSVALALASGCAPTTARPGNVFIGTRDPAGWPRPDLRSSGPAQIQAMRFSSLDFPLGSEWYGAVVTSSNTASVQFFTPLFDFMLPRQSPGRFTFRTHVLDLPAFLVRPYNLRVKARNAAGEVTEVDVPLVIRGR